MGGMMDAKDIKITDKSPFGESFRTASDVHAFAVQASMQIDGIIADIKALQAGGGGGGGGGGIVVDYTAILNSIKTSVGAIDADTDKLQPIFASVDGLEDLLTSGNATTVQIANAVDDLKTACQKIDANTDDVERVLGLVQTSLTSLIGYVDGVEGLLGNVQDRLTDIKALLGQTHTPNVKTLSLVVGSNAIGISSCKSVDIANPLTATAAITVVTAGGNITLEAGESVAFGNGLSTVDTSSVSITASAIGTVKIAWEA